MTTSSKSPVRAVVLAAGQGKRMKSSRAKVLHDVLGKPIVGWILHALDHLAVEKIHVVIGHQAEQLQEYLSSNPPKQPFATHLQSPQLGTGHALQIVVPDFGNWSGTLLVTVGDTPLLSAKTLGDLIARHQAEKAVVSLLTAKVDDPKKYGRIVRDAKGEVLKIVEDKDATPEEKKLNEVNPAIYCFEWPAIAEGLNSLRNDNQQKEYYLTDLIEWAKKQGHKVSSHLVEDWREVIGINTRVDLAEAISLMRDRVVSHLALESGVTIVDPASTWISPTVEIGEDSVVLPGSYLIGDVKFGRECTIGPHTVTQGKVVVGDRTVVAQSLLVNSEIGSECRVGPFAHVREHAQVSDNCRIGNFVEIKKSSIAKKTNVSHLSYIGDAELGSRVNIGAGTITANYDHMTRTKSRTVIADGASTGSNSVLVAPIKLGVEAVVAAGTVATKDVPDGALAVARARQENKEGWAARKKNAIKSLT
jgi:bifunctional UDP-N-acetylglucosamine pyrophosphorylase / glucosamine-1-phosphate N-acetyltransferase